MSVVDPEVLQALERDLGGREVVEEVVRAYLELLPERRQAVLVAAGSDDLVQLRREAHTLGSASALVGAVALADLCRTLEATHGPPDAPALGRLPSAWTSSSTETEDALAAWLAEADGSGQQDS